MKKFLTAISLLLIVVMTMAMVPAYATEAATEASYTMPSNVNNVWYAGDAITAKKHGFTDRGIAEGEYTKLFETRKDPVAYLNTYTAEQIAAGVHQTNAGGSYNSQYDDVVADDFYNDTKKQMVSQEMDFYVSYDADYIYIAFRDLGAAYDFNGNGTIDGNEYSFRNNYRLRLGINLDDPKQHLMLDDSDLGFLRYSGGLDALTLDGSGNSTQDIPNGLVKDVQVTKVSTDGNYMQEGNGNFKAANGRANEVFVELKLDKDQFLVYSNKYCGTNYAEFPNAMFISFCEKTYLWADDDETIVGSNIESLWVGSKTGDTTAGSHDWDFAPDVVIFGEEGTEIKVPAAPTALTGTQFGNVGQKVHYAGASRSVTMDGYVGEGEYTLNHNLQSPSLFMTNDGYLAVRKTTYSYDRLSSEEMTFSFAHDADNIYIAFTDVGGAFHANKDAGTCGYSFRCNYHYRLGFDFGDEYVFIQFGAGGPVTNVEVKFGSKNGSNAALWGDAKGYKSSAFVVKNPIAKYKYDYMTDTIGDLINTDGGNSKVGPYIEFSELQIDKAALLKVVNDICNTNYAELPGAMYFTMVERSYVWNPNGEASDSVFAYGNYATDTAWMATATPDGTWGYMSDIVVFGEEGTALEAPCNFNVKTESDATLMAACASNDLYYYSCACGKIANGGADVGGYLSYFVGTTDAAADHTPNIPEATDTEDKVCTTCLAVLDEAKGHVHEYADNYATNGAQHWRECSCGAKAELGNHNGSPCSVCGYGASAPSVPVTPPEDTTAPEDTTPEETTAPEDTTPAESESESETEPADDSCGGTISIMGLALVAALGACGVVATKKKED